MVLGDHGVEWEKGPIDPPYGDRRSAAAVANRQEEHTAGRGALARGDSDPNRVGTGHNSHGRPVPSSTTTLALVR